MVVLSVIWTLGARVWPFEVCHLALLTKSHSLSWQQFFQFVKDIWLRSTLWKWIRLKGCLKQHILVLGYISCMLYISYFLQEWQFGVEVPCCTSLVPKSKKLLLLLDFIACRKIGHSLKLMGKSLLYNLFLVLFIPNKNNFEIL